MPLRRPSWDVVMPIFSNPFRKRSVPPPELDSLYRKIDSFLNDDAFRNSLMPPQLRAEIEAGEDADELSDGKGSFGRTVTNPIPVNGPAGELIYLASLQASDGSFVMGHRLGSIGRVDVYETVSATGEHWGLLYFSLYHPRRSRKAPEGYSLLPKLSTLELTATNDRLDDFPGGMTEAVRRAAKGIGLPTASTAQITSALQRTFCRSRGHNEELRRVQLELQGRIDGSAIETAIKIPPGEAGIEARKAILSRLFGEEDRDWRSTDDKAVLHRTNDTSLVGVKDLGSLGYGRIVRAVNLLLGERKLTMWFVEDSSLDRGPRPIGEQAKDTLKVFDSGVDGNLEYDLAVGRDITVQDAATARSLSQASHAYAIHAYEDGQRQRRFVTRSQYEQMSSAMASIAPTPSIDLNKMLEQARQDVDKRRPR